MARASKMTCGIHCCPNLLIFYLFCPTNISTLRRIYVYITHIYIWLCRDRVWIAAFREAILLCLLLIAYVWQSTQHKLYVSPLMFTAALHANTKQPCEEDIWQISINKRRQMSFLTAAQRVRYMDRGSATWIIRGQPAQHHDRWNCGCTVWFFRY